MEPADDRIRGIERYPGYPGGVAKPSKYEDFYDNDDDYVQPYVPRPGPSLFDTLFGPGFFQYTFFWWCMRLPVVLITWLIYLVFIPVVLLLEAFAFVCRNLHWIVLFVILFAVAISGSYYYADAISGAEHAFRCRIKPYWIDSYKDLAATLTTAWENGICWWNAMVGINRAITGPTLLKMFTNCDNGFTIWDWITLTSDLIFDFIKSLLVWAFIEQPLDSAVSTYAPFSKLYTVWIPKTNEGVVCACGSARFLTLWFTRVMNTDYAACMSYQLSNFAAGLVQVPVNFMFDMVRFISSYSYQGFTSADVKDVLKDPSSVNSPVPSLSKSELKERLGAFAVYAGFFLNRAFTVTYCHFYSEIEGMGDEPVADAMYDTCMGDPNNHYDLFCALGPAVAGYMRLMSLQSKLLINLPTILNEFGTKPAGPRYFIDDLWDIESDYVFDTFRPPQTIYNYAQSVNYPTIAVLPNSTNPPKSSILFGPSNTRLYGDTSNTTCKLTNNSRRQVACAECGKVADYDLATCAARTGADLDRLLEPFIGMKIWTPTLGIVVPSLLKGATAAARFLSGFVAHIFNMDRMLEFLTDQNHYDHFFDGMFGKPYEFGGVFRGVREGVIEFDERLYCLSNLVLKPFKSYAEGARILVTAICRFTNTLADTGEPGLASYVCISFPQCLELERAVSWLRRPRTSFAYDPRYTYIAPSLLFEPAFLDCMCWLLDLQFLSIFTPDPPVSLPKFCCFPHFFARWSIENIIIVIQFWLSVLETAITIIDSSATLRLATIEWAACIDFSRCSNLGAILSDVEDLLNCGCAFIIWLNEILSVEAANKFPCLCDFLSAAVQWWTNAERSALLFGSCFYDLLYCLGNGWPEPHCTDNLHDRLTVGFGFLDASFNALSGMFGSLGCVVGLPWVGLEADCLGVRFTWPKDHSRCNTSAHGVGICTMADRLRMVAYYLHQMTLVLFKFAYKRVQTVIDVAFAVISESDLAENSISLAIMNFFLEIRDPLFGRSNKLLYDDFDTVTNGPWPNYTGINTTKLAATVATYQNITNIAGYNYQDPPSSKVYSYTFNYSSIAGLDETTGLVHAGGLTLSCLLGPPTTSCIGPRLLAPSTIRYNRGCLGDPAGAIADGIRDVYTMIVKFVFLGLNVIETLFMNPENFGEAVRAWINSFFKLLIVLLDSIDRLVEALVMVIVEVSRFIFGDGVAEMLKFFLTFIAKVISLFISVIKFLLFPFGGGKRAVELNVETILEQTFTNTTLADLNKEMMKDASTLSKSFADAYAMGYDTVFAKRSGASRKRAGNDTAAEDDDNILIKIWKRLNYDTFTADQASQMTDDTFCKKAMVKLTPTQGTADFDGFSLGDEAIWKSCFLLYSLPNELYAYSGGKLSVEPDAFYNIDKLHVYMVNGLSMLGDSIEWGGQTGKYVGAMPNAFFIKPVSPEDGSVSFNYTEVVSLPQSILDLISIQLDHRRSDIAMDLLQTFSIVAGVTPLTTIKKRFDVYDAVSDGVVDWGELGQMECIPYIKPGVSGCWDVDRFEPGFNIEFGPNVNKAWYGSNDGLFYDPKLEFVYDLFNNTNATIYTNLKGFAYIYVSRTNITYPVIDGKISFEIQNTTLSAYGQTKYPEDSFAQFVADGTTKLSQEKSMTDYLIMLNRIQGNFTPSSSSEDSVNVTAIIEFYKNARTKNETDNVVDPEGNVMVRKRLYEKMKSSSAKFTNLVSHFMSHSSNMGDAMNRNAQYYGNLNKLVREMKASPDKFGASFNKKKNDGAVKYMAFEHSTKDENIFWVDTVSKRIQNLESQKRQQPVKRWVLQDEDYVYESPDISVSATHYHSVTRYDKIKESYETVREPFSWSRYFRETVPAAAKHFYASRFSGRSRFESKLKRWNTTNHDDLYDTHSLSESFRLYGLGDSICGHNLNSEDTSGGRYLRRKAEEIEVDMKEMFVVTLEYPMQGLDSANLTDHNVTTTQPLKKLYNFLYLEPWLPKDAPRDDKVGRYDAYAGNAAYLNKFGPFDKHLLSHPDLSDSEQADIDVVKLGFDVYEYDHVHSYANNDCHDRFSWTDTMVTFKRKSVEYTQSYLRDAEFEKRHETMYFNLGHSAAPCGGDDLPPSETIASDIETEMLEYLILRYNELDAEKKRNGNVPQDRIGTFFSSLYKFDYIPQRVEVNGDLANMTVTYRVVESAGKEHSHNVTVVYDGIVFDVEKCFKAPPNDTVAEQSKKRGESDSPKVVSIYNFLSDVIATRANRTSEVFRKKTREILDHVQNKHKITYDNGKVPSIDRLFLSTSTWSIDSLAESLGYDGEKTEGYYASFSNAYLEWSGYFGAFGRQDHSKRTHQPKMIQFCLPQPPGTSDKTTCKDCRGCESEYCSACSSCGDCELGAAGFYDCSFCSNCRVNGPFCQGRCFQCTDCVTEQPCLDCRLVEYLLTKMIYYVNYCVETQLLGNSAFVLRPPPGVSFFNTTAYTGELPSFSDYGVLKIFPYLFAILFHAINSSVSVDVLAALSNIITNVNFDPFTGSVGMLFVVWDFLISPCNFDIHLQCVFGLGLVKGITWSSIVVGIGISAWFWNPNVAGLFGSMSNIVAGGSLVTFWLGLTAYLSWFYKPRCLAAGGMFLITNLLGWNILPSVYGPTCAVPEINALLSDIFDTNWSLPSSVVTNNITFSSPCSQRVVTPDCSKYGYNGALDPSSIFVTIGYIGQQFLPASARVWVVDYLNRTALGYNSYIAGSVGPLAPFYAVNFDATVPSNEGEYADFCFYLNLPYTILVVLLFFFILYALYRILTVALAPLVVVPLTFLLQFPAFQFIFSDDTSAMGRGTRTPNKPIKAPTRSAPAKKGGIGNVGAKPVGKTKVPDNKGGSKSVDGKKKKSESASGKDKKQKQQTNTKANTKTNTKTQPKKPTTRKKQSTK